MLDAFASSGSADREREELAERLAEAPTAESVGLHNPEEEDAFISNANGSA